MYHGFLPDSLALTTKSNVVEGFTTPSRSSLTDVATARSGVQQGAARSLLPTPEARAQGDEHQRLGRLGTIRWFVVVLQSEIELQPDPVDGAKWQEPG